MPANNHLWVWCVMGLSCSLAGCESVSEVPGGPVAQSVVPGSPDKASEKPQPGAAKAPVFVSTPTPRVVPTPQSESQAQVPTRDVDLAAFTADLGVGTLYATLKTNHGEIRCTLYEDRAPVTVANFVGLARGLKAWSMPEILDTLPPRIKGPGKPMVNTPLYDGRLCHRVIPNFVIQCGDPSGLGSGNPGYKIPDEFDRGLTHDRPGILSMANAGPGTGGSQFFITEQALPHLDGMFAIFGQCEDLDVIKEIASVPRDPKDRPLDDVIIEHIEIERVKESSE